MQTLLIMEKKIYGLSVGTVMIIASLAFFMVPALIQGIDAFILIMFSFVSFLVGVASFFLGFTGD